MTVFLFLMLFALVYGLLVAYQRSNIREMSYSQFHTELEAGRIKKIELQATNGEFTTSSQARLTLQNGSVAHVTIPPMGLHLDQLLAHNVVVIQKRTSLLRKLAPFLLRIAAPVLTLGCVILLVQAILGQSDLSGVSGLVQPIEHSTTIPTTRFKDVIGIEEAKTEVQELVTYLKDPRMYKKIGAKLPKGVVLHGPPGTGKTLLAKALAGEAQVPFLYFSASEFEEVFVGIGASRVRAEFKKARERSPCIIFIDELDSLGNRNGGELGYSTHHQTLNQLLTELDGFVENSGIIVIGATNRLEDIDPALLRSGRFDLKIAITLPTLKAREEILAFYLEKLNHVDPAIDLKHFSLHMLGWSGADVANFVNISAMLAVRDGRDMVLKQDLELALERMQMGVKVDLDAIEEPEHLRRTAYHEAGHAIISLALERPDEYSSLQFSRISIYRHGSALGHVITVDANEHGRSKKTCMERLAVLYGGRIAEELIYGPIETGPGAYSDLESAYQIAREMVTVYGFQPTEEALQRHYPAACKLSEAMKVDIEKDVSEFLAQAHATARETLESNRSAFEALAAEVLKRKSLTAQEVKEFFTNRNITLQRPQTI